MAQPYELKFDKAEGRYKPVDITAVLKKLEQGEYVEIDFTEVEFKPDVDELLSFEVRQDGSYQIAKVDVLQEALDRDDFDERIKSPVRVEVTAKPPAEEGKQPPDVKAECEVTIDPAPSVVKVIHPAPEELPWPAKPEEKMPVELQLFRGSESKPLKNTSVSLERKDASAPPCGEWDADGGPPKTTDDQGVVKFTFVPNELYYKPGGRYYEEYTVWTGEGEGRREVGAFKFAVAPRVKFKVEVEKKATVADQEFGLFQDPEPETVELELGPQLKIDALKIVPELPEDGQGSATRLPVAFAKLKILFLDKEDGETAARESEPVTDENGLYECKLPELTEAFTGPTKYDLKEKKENPVCKLNEVAERTIKGYQTRVESNTPKELFNGSFYQQLVEYRKTFCAQMAGKRSEEYETVESAAEILCRAAGYTKIFNNMYNDQWGRMGDVFGNTLSDLLAFVVTLGGVGEKCVTDWAPNIGRYLGEWIDKLASKRWVRVIARYIRRKLNSGLRTIRGYLDDMFGWLGRELPGTLQSIVQRGRAGLAQLGRDIDELVSVTAPPESTAGEVLEAMKEWFTNMFRLIFNAVGTILRVLADAMVGIVSFVLRGLARIFAAGRDALSPVLEEYVRPALQHATKVFCEAFGEVYNAADHSYNTLNLSKMVEVAIAWINDKFKVTSSAGDATGKSIVSGLCVMDWLADPVVGSVHEHAEKLDVTSPHKPRTDLFRDFCSWTGHAKNVDEKLHAGVDEWVSHIDNFILCAELIIMLVVTLFSLGGGAAIAAAFTKIELAVGYIKLKFVRLPQAVAVVVGAFMIASMYTVGTVAVGYKT